MQSGANIVANDSSISDVEISYLDGVVENVQDQTDDNDKRNNNP